MTSDDESSFDPQIGVSLLSYVRRRNIEALKTHLIGLSNPHVYLNRLYNERDDKKCTLLALACLNQYEDMVLMLLDHFQANLEVLNQVRIMDRDDHFETFHDVTVLWIAAALNHFPLVKLLVERGGRVNHMTRTRSTPLRCACCNDAMDMARYLVEHGADVNITKEKHYTNLIASVFNGHLKMVTFLVDELGCDVNECLDDGRSPLGAAVYHGSLELVQFLLQRGSRNFPAVCDRMSPLMLAAEKRRSDLVQAISSFCSLNEQIEAQELLASSFVCGELGDRDFAQSFDHFCRALQLRTTHQIAKPIRESSNKVFNHRRECQTLEELKEVQFHASHLTIEALLTRERILGPMSSRYHHALRYHGAALADDEHYHAAVATWSYELELHRQYSIDINKETLHHFSLLLVQMQSLSLPISISTLQFIISVILEQLERRNEDFDYHLQTLLVFITLISQILTRSNLIETDRRLLSRLVRSIVQRQYTTVSHGSSLLHLSLNSPKSSRYYRYDSAQTYPSLSTVDLLVRCGASIDAMDKKRNTPLHVFALQSRHYDEKTFEVLSNANAHLDYANEDGQTPLNLTTNRQLQQLLSTRTKLSLKCSCARLIRKANISLSNEISPFLIDFVERH